MCSVGLLDPQLVQEKKDQIKESYKRLFLETDFNSTLSGGLQRKSSILRRRSLWASLLDEAIK